ncbi:MAG: TonB-dependent receptor [Gluconacetobacter diazotrophicus]|nr:TonB-dependent receptor [Gluconacetobacter diazotrophicus]
MTMPPGGVHRGLEITMPGTAGGMTPRLCPSVRRPSWRLPVFGILCLPLPAHARGDAAAAPPAEQVEVVGTAGLDRLAPVGSRLGLTLQDLPATVDAMSRATMLQRGSYTAEDAVDMLPGVTSGGSPGNPGQFVLRGFTGNEVTVLHDGTYLGPVTMVNRPQNSFNLDDVEVLQGPASVLYGQGAVGGVVDERSRSPVLGRRGIEALASYGSFDTWNGGIDVNQPIGGTAAARIDLSRSSSGGYVDGARPASLDLTAAVLWQNSRRVTVRLSVDALRDQLSSYYGTPLVPVAAADTVGGGVVGGLLNSSQGLAIGRDTLWKNYDVRDFTTTNTSVRPATRIDWQASDRLMVHEKAYFFYAARRWQNAETYTFIPAGSNAVDAAGNPIPANSIARDRFHVFHDQHQVGDTLDATLDGHVFGLANRVVVGVDGYYLRFIRNSGFPDAQYADAVPLVDPVRGEYGTFPGDLPSRKSPTTIGNVAGFAEDVLSVTPRLRLVTGYRYDWLRLERSNYTPGGSFNAATSFSGTYHPDNGRVGVVWEPRQDLSLYASWTTADDPPGSNIFLANAGQFTGLSHSEQEEVGIKAQFPDHAGEATLSAYHIERDDILEATGPDTVATAGSQHSNGIEFQTLWRLAAHWTVTANAAWTRSRFGGFQPDAGTDATGKRPPDVPAVTGNLWLVWDHAAGSPVDLGVGWRHVGDRAGDYAGTLDLKSYDTVDVFAAWHLRRGLTAAGRIGNLLDRRYVQWADVSYPTEVIVGAPRSFSASLQAAF